MIRDIKGFIFDMDGVLTETSEYHYLAWKVLAGHLGIHIDKGINEQLKGVSRMESLNVILEYGELEDKYSEEQKVQLATKKNKHYIEMIDSFTEKNLLGGVRQLFEELKRNQLKIGIASASHSASKLMNLLAIESYIDYIVDPSGLRSKPSPDIFLQCAKGLGLEPRMCIGVEDAVAGVKAIKKADMYAIGIGDEKVLWEADIVYHKTGDIWLDEVLSLARIKP